MYSMTTDWLDWVNKELGAAFEMLSDAIAAADDATWDSPRDKWRFWNIAYHTVFFLDIYLSDFDPEISNVEEQYRLPEYVRDWSESVDFGNVHEPAMPREVLMRFLEETRGKLRSRFADGTVADQVGEMVTSWLKMTKGAMLLYNMRHVMQHIGHLNDVLRGHGLVPGRWRARIPI
jgi:hypothetical protein